MRSPPTCAGSVPGAGGRSFASRVTREAERESAHAWPTGSGGIGAARAAHGPPALLVVGCAFGDPGEDGEDLLGGEAAARGGETRTALRHHRAATRKPLAEDAVGELASPDAARLHAQQLAGGGRDVHALGVGDRGIEALAATRLLRRAGVAARDRAAGGEDGLHVLREARLRRAWRAGEPQLVPVAPAARGRGDGEARLPRLDPREREPERQGEPRRGAAVAGGVERRERGGERLTRAVVARLDGRRPAQAGRRARAQARDVDAALEAERADTVDLSVDVAGLTVGARFAHAREVAPGDEAVGRRWAPARDAVGRTAGPGCWGEYQDERESDRYPHCSAALRSNSRPSIRRGRTARRRRRTVAQASLLTLAACRPLGPCVTSNVTRCPSSRVRKPEPAIAE